MQPISCDTCKRRPSAGTLQGRIACAVCAQEKYNPAIKENKMPLASDFADTVMTSAPQRVNTTAQMRAALRASVLNPDHEHRPANGDLNAYDRFARGLIAAANDFTASAIKVTVCSETRLIAGQRAVNALLAFAHEIEYDPTHPHVKRFVYEVLCRWTAQHGWCKYRARAMFKTLVRPFSGSKSGAQMPYMPVHTRTPDEWSALDVTTVDTSIQSELEQDIGARFRRPHLRVPGATTGRASYDTGAMARIMLRHVAHDPQLLATQRVSSVDKAAFGQRVVEAARQRDAASPNKIGGKGPLSLEAPKLGPFLEMARQQTKRDPRRASSVSPRRDTSGFQQFVAKYRDAPDYTRFVEHLWRLYRTSTGVDLQTRARADATTGKALADVAKIIEYAAEELTLLTSDERQAAITLARELLDDALLAMEREFAPTVAPAPPARDDAMSAVPPTDAFAAYAGSSSSSSQSNAMISGHKTRYTSWY